MFILCSYLETEKKKISRNLKKKKWNSLFSQFLGFSHKIPRLSKTPFSTIFMMIILSEDVCTVTDDFVAE